MKHISRLTLKSTSFLVFLYLSTACSVESAPQSSSGIQKIQQQASPKLAVNSTHQNSESKSEIKLEKAIKDVIAFTQSNKSKITDQLTESSMTPRERIVSGFEQDPPRQLRLEDGTTIVWGWQEGQAEHQSLAIFDNTGKIRMAGAADNIPVLYSKVSSSSTSSLDEYQTLLDDRSTYMASPVMHLYFGDQDDANKFYPLASRWLQAAMMGFNAKCKDPEQEKTCGLVQQIHIPVSLSINNCPQTESSNPACSLSVSTSDKKPYPAIDDYTQ
ncbi:hypothetical protein [Xanthomonas cerealis]|uniref:hypothetical protein n=1 Tax=Xanthomonas cerealis TaxID=3390025 RepID=UPI000A97D036|nr:hypothetical protein [Xanthomonas translucens]UKE47099.1 hypothetical protein KHA79_19005 [Xanthomonas translucens pv. cerealis]UKE69436.1 hypothetical protein K8O61_18755 [Xanthomonas translucens pv. pistacia]